MHLFFEMTLDPEASPSTRWTYQDEDWGGKMADLAQRRGGALTCLAVGSSMSRRKP